MRETEKFINDGYGWTCKVCRDRRDSDVTSTDLLPRYFREGEAEEKELRLSTTDLARWRESTDGRFLLCPRCGAEERMGSK